MRRALRLMSLFLLGSSLCACAPFSRTPTPTLPALTSTPSPTVGFPTLPPHSDLTPAPEPHTHSGHPRYCLGTTLFHDDFSTDQGWDLSSDFLGALSLEAGQLVLAHPPDGHLPLRARPRVKLQDFYLQVTLRAELCNPNDEFGVMIRFTPEGENYRIGLHCDGRARITRVLSDSSIALVLPTTSPF